MKGCARRTDARDTFAVVQRAIDEELQPQKDGVVIQAYEANISLVERRLIEIILSGRAYALALHAPRHLLNELTVLRQDPLFRVNADLIVDIKGRDEDQEQGVLRADEPAGVEELLELLLRIWPGRRAETESGWNVHIQQIEQIVESKSARRAAGTNPDHRFQGGPVVGQAEIDDALVKLFGSRAGSPVSTHGFALFVVHVADAGVGIVTVAKDGDQVEKSVMPAFCDTQTQGLGDAIS